MSKTSDVKDVFIVAGAVGAAYLIYKTISPVTNALGKAAGAVGDAITYGGDVAAGAIGETKKSLTDVKIGYTKLESTPEGQAAIDAAKYITVSTVSPNPADAVKTLLSSKTASVAIPAVKQAISAVSGQVSSGVKTLASSTKINTSTPASTAVTSTAAVASAAVKQTTLGVISPAIGVKSLVASLPPTAAPAVKAAASSVYSSVVSKVTAAEKSLVSAVKSIFKW
jgi:hypothetical protein